MVSRHFKRGHLDHSQQQDILKDVGSKILAKAPGGWERIVYTRQSVIDHSSSSLTIELEDGRKVEPWMPSGLGLLFRDLRAGMYQEGKGTWFSLRYVITRPGKFKVEYNYDDDPKILFPTAWGFTNDLKYFPRDEEYIPGWLREKLREEEEGRATGFVPDDE